VTLPEGEDLISGLSFDDMQQEGHRRDTSQKSKFFPVKQCPEERYTGSSSSQPDYAKVAKQARECSFQFNGLEKQLEFLKLV